MKDESLFLKSPNLKGSMISNKDSSLLQDTVPMEMKAVSTAELQRVVKGVNIDKIRERVFQLYELSMGVDAQL